MHNSRVYNSTAAFVMPHKMGSSKYAAEHLKCAVNSVIEQSDNDWILIIVDDYSNDTRSNTFLKSVEEEFSGKIIVLHTDRNIGAGEARNLGIMEAAKRKASFILFIDDDDISDNNRLKTTRRLFDTDNSTNVVYSSFLVIDELGQVVDTEMISPSVRDILEGHKSDIVDGSNSWIPIATMKNYTNLTSCTAVKTELAIKEPFPAYSVSEDSNTWLRYGAYQGTFRFIDGMKNYYRVCSGTSSRSRAENSNFYQQKALAEVQGVNKASEISREYGLITSDEGFEIKVRFFVRLSLSMIYGDEIDLAKEYYLRAFNMSQAITDDAVSRLRFINTAFSEKYKKMIVEVK